MGSSRDNAGGRPRLEAVLNRELPGLREAVPLAPYTAYRVGGPAEFLIEARSDEALLRALAVGTQLGLPVTVLGQATNVLVGDGGIPGLVVLARNEAVVIEDDLLRAGAGAVLSTVVLDLAERSLAGLEFAGNIPGSVGGAVVGNAGAYGRCVADVLASIDLALPDGERLTVSPRRLAFAYRSSILKRRSGTVTASPAPGLVGEAAAGAAPGLVGEAAAGAAPRVAGEAAAGAAPRVAGAGAAPGAAAEMAGTTDASPAAEPPSAAPGPEPADRDLHMLAPQAVVLGARFRLAPGTRNALLGEIARDAELRRSKHPLEYASCGSYFKNPSAERPAARYIQGAGLKGLVVGRAQVSERHANFLVALDGARAADILALAAEVKRRVLEEYGLQLDEEVVHLGVD